jgi:tripartite-type tricarboxylate transporter receptor subunit TctC
MSVFQGRIQAWRISALLAAGLMAGGAVPCAAQGVGDFYRGKTVSLVMGTGPGGSYDLYGRVLAEFLGRHIPGNPTIIIEQMPGAGGVIAGNYIYGPGPQDGTKILMSHPLPLIEKLEPSQGVRYESAKLNWLGTYDSIDQVMTLWHTAPARTIDELKVKDLIIGSFNKSHLSYQWAMLTKNALQANYKVITGYPSGNDLNLAMERGEIHGWVAAWANIIGTKPNWLRDKSISIPVQFTLERLPDLRDVPTLLELAPPEKKDIVEFISAGQPMSRGLAVGPGVPAERVAALRTAFDALMQDKAFLAVAKERNLDIHPRNATQVQSLVETITSASPDLIGRVKQAIGQ